MKLTEKEIRALVDNPKQAKTGEEFRLLKLVTGKGRPCTNAEKRALAVIQQYRRVRTEGSNSNAPARQTQRTAPPVARNRGTKKKFGKTRGPQASDSLEQRKLAAQRYRKSLPVRDTGPHRPQDYRRYINEGISGSREDNKKTRNKNFSDLRRRNYE